METAAMLDFYSVVLNYTYIDTAKYYREIFAIT